VPTAAPGDPEKSNGPRSRKGARTRERLVDAAKVIFEEHGFLEARVSDITDEAGLSHGSFYYYFESKEEVFREVAEAVDELLSAPLGDVILDDSSQAAPRERIREAMRRYFESYRDQARILGVIEQVSRYDDQVGAIRLARHQRYTEQVADSIRRLQHRQLADPKLDPAIIAGALGAVTTRFAEMYLVQGAIDCPFEDAIDQVALLFVNTLGLDGPTSVSPSRGSAGS